MLTLRSDKLNKSFSAGLFGLIAISHSALADVPAEVQAVFVNNGCLGCHAGANPSGGLSLADAATSEAELVDVDANCNGNEKLVVPGEPDNSVLYQKISQANPDCGGVMPPGGNLISVADRNTINDWIVSIGPASMFGLIEMENTAVQVQETDPEVVLTVNRQLGTQGQITVDYAVETVGTDTATSPDDYIADTGTLVFEDGETSQTITVTLADDDIFEGTEVFSVTLSNVVNGAVLGSGAQTKVTIIDNEFDNQPGTFFFSRVNYNAGEGDGTLDVTVIRSFGAAGMVTVDVTSVDGTATAGMDYTAVSETLQFEEGVRQLNFSIALLEDQDIENDEAFTIRLENPTNGALLGNPTSVTVIVSDNDGSTGGGGSGGSGGSDGSDGSGGGDGSGSGGGTSNPDPEVEADYEAAGSMGWLLPLILLGLLRRRVK